MTTEFKVGQILENSLRQFTKIVSIRNGIYGITGWMSRESALKSNVVHKFVNIYGLQYAGSKVVKGGKTSAPEVEGNGKTDADLDTPSKSSINKLVAADAKALAEKEGLSSEGTAKEVKERLVAHFGL